MNNLLLGGGAPQIPPGSTGAPSASASPAALGVISPTVVALLGQEKPLTVDDVTKAVARDLGSSSLNADDKKLVISDSVGFLSSLGEAIGRLGPNASARNVDGVIRGALHNLGSAAPPPVQPHPGMLPAPGSIPQADIDRAHGHLDSVISELLNLTSKPAGSLKHKHLYEAAAAMLSSGAFPTREGRSQLMGELARAPADEPSIRSALGGYLGRVVDMKRRVELAYGPRSARNG